MIDIARHSQDPKAYAVLNQFLRTVGALSKEILKVQETKKSILAKPEAIQQANNITNHQTVIMTTADRLKMIDDRRNGITE